MEPETSIQQGRRKRKFSKRSKRYHADFKLQVVKKFIEESVPVPVIVQECGVSHETGSARCGRPLYELYRSRTQSSRSGKKKIVELKEASPTFGISHRLPGGSPSRPG